MFQPDVQFTFSVKNVFNLIKSIKSNAGGPDEIPGFVFHTHANHFASSLSIIFNASIFQKTFPILCMQMLYQFLTASPILDQSLFLISLF